MAIHCQSNAICSVCTAATTTRRGAKIGPAVRMKRFGRRITEESEEPSQDQDDKRPSSRAIFMYPQSDMFLQRGYHFNRDRHKMCHLCLLGTEDATQLLCDSTTFRAIFVDVLTRTFSSQPRNQYSIQMHPSHRFLVFELNVSFLCMIPLVAFIGGPFFEGGAYLNFPPIGHHALAEFSCRAITAKARQQHGADPTSRPLLHPSRCLTPKKGGRSFEFWGQLNFGVD